MARIGQTANGPDGVGRSRQIGEHLKSATAGSCRSVPLSPKTASSQTRSFGLAGAGIPGTASFRISSGPRERPGLGRIAAKQRNGRRMAGSRKNCRLRTDRGTARSGLEAAFAAVGTKRQNVTTRAYRATGSHFGRLPKRSWTGITNCAAIISRHHGRALSRPRCETGGRRAD